jgi:hypothetical protein
MTALTRADGEACYRETRGAAAEIGPVRQFRRDWT